MTAKNASKTTVALDTEDWVILRKLTAKLRTSDADSLRRGIRHLLQTIEDQDNGIIPAQFDESTGEYTLIRYVY